MAKASPSIPLGVVHRFRSVARGWWTKRGAASTARSIVEAQEPSFRQGKIEAIWPFHSHQGPDGAGLFLFLQEQVID